ncbi:MAG: PadR family transcriptional regulator [Acidimicrobiia bacterium]|nr:PadR family transcriptional regulator [Acidimicrobiia bacterium]
MSAKRAILGLLVEQPLHGYGVEKVIEQRGMRKWTSIGFASIYHIVDHLVTEGLAKAVVEPAPGRGKERKVHHVTALGRQRWSADTLLALATVTDTDADFLTALSCLPLLDQRDATHSLEQHNPSPTASGSLARRQNYAEGASANRK